jgi:hypothetical protein
MPKLIGKVTIYIAGADPGFEVRGRGDVLKKITPSGGRREHFWGYFV